MKASEEIRSILDRCKSGELKHDQATFCCGSSRCIAGWKCQLDYEKSTKSKNKAWEFVVDWMYEKHGLGAAVYAQTQWKLTVEQAAALFSAIATYPEQYAVVEELEAAGL